MSNSWAKGLKQQQHHRDPRITAVLTCNRLTETEAPMKIRQDINAPSKSYKFKHGINWRNPSTRIWHSEDRASWYILIIKPMIYTNFSNLFLE